MLDNRTVGKTISQLRQANGMTQQQLAATMNVSHQAVSKWETGQALPDMQTMLDLSRLFGVSMEQLLLGEVPEARLHARDDKEKTQTPGFDLRSAMEDVVNGIGNLFKGAPEAKDEAPVEEETVSEEAPAEEAVEADKDEQREAEAKEDQIVIDRIIEMAPFMSRVALEDMLKQYRGKFTPREVAKLAPFLTSETLEALIWRVDGKLDWDLLRRIAPFLQRDVVDRLTWAYVQGEKAVRPAMENVGRAAEQLGRNIQKKVGEVDFDKLGEQITSGISQAVKSAQEFGESVAREVEKAFAPAASDPKARKEASEEMRAARRRMFERAMDEGKWDWIAERLDGLEDAELKADIAARAAAEGKANWLNAHFEGYVSEGMIDKAVNGHDWAWLSEHLERVDIERHPELARAAAAEGAWDFLVENVNFMELGEAAPEIALCAAVAGEEALLETLSMNHLTEEENLNVALRLIEANKENLLPTVLPHLDAAGVDKVSLALCEAKKWDALEEAIVHADEAAVDAACLRLAAADEWDRVKAHLGEISADAVARLMVMAVEAGNWDAIEALEGYMD